MILEFQFLWILAILILGCIVQGGIGFGGGLVVLQLLLVIGLPLFQCVIYTIILSIVVCMLCIWKMAAHCHWRTLLPLIAVVIAAMPVGFYFQYLLAALDQTVVRMWIGAVVILFLLARWLLKVHPRDRIAPGWGFLAASLSGILSAFANIGGPPIALWVHSHLWSGAQIRVTLMVFILVSTPFQLAFALSAYGQPAVTAALNGLLTIPFLLAGGWIGLLIGGRLETKILRYITHGMLLFLSVTPFFQFFGLMKY